ncbi:MAG: alpha/beta fold hydrolase [Flavobacteriaceae bacterium]|nr:alpha/beta fold hydrolase [Flavobacteriaceae bacterium]
MNQDKVNFYNNNGEKLAGRIELPANGKAHSFALFAHCFTCNKNLSAVRNISRALTSKGFGVLRFDFTGLGESDGDFEDTNFSGNVQDLIAAADFLKESYIAPNLIIGHSLGGAAVVFAANQLSHIQAVATIGAPSNPEHVRHLFENKLEEIQSSGLAEVNLGGRKFTIKKQFVDDLEEKSMPATLQSLRKPIIILHSPQDTTVGIKNAEENYKNARHPKSFVSLDGADHLLMNKNDSVYVGEVIASWATRYIKIDEEQQPDSEHSVVAVLNKNDAFFTPMKVGNHFLKADEPESYGGTDLGPSPYEYLSAGLAACTVMTIQMYAKRKDWDVQSVECHVDYGKKHIEDCENCDAANSKIDVFTRYIKLEGNLDEAQKKRILEIADKCPVHKTLHSDIKVETKSL